MKTSLAAAALIRKDEKDQVLWLARWSRSWRRFHLVGGHKEGQESFRECLVREIGEELGLAEHRDYEMAVEPRAHLEFIAYSERTKQETAYATELFEVQIHDGPARVKVDSDQRNRWLTEAEIRSSRCADGKPISPTMEIILSKINWGH